MCMCTCVCMHMFVSREQRNGHSEKYSTNAEVHTLICGVTSVHKFDFSITFQLNKDTNGTITE
jgi:hypothetical protein